MKVRADVNFMMAVYVGVCRCMGIVGSGWISGGVLVLCKRWLVGETW